jgi:hypothetical protein
MGKTEIFELENAADEISLRNVDCIRERRSFERRHLPFLKTLLDFDIVCEVGFHQLAGTPLTVKHLLLRELAPAITVLRRLNRLYALEIVARDRSPSDGRVHELRLTSRVLALYLEYGRLHRPMPGTHRKTAA